jgi:hypothetical protein
MADSPSVRRRPGRPRIDASDESVNVSVTLPAKRYDDLSVKARQARLTLQEFIRQQLGIRPRDP